jgi:hypothetical protein
LTSREPLLSIQPVEVGRRVHVEFQTRKADHLGTQAGAFRLPEMQPQAVGAELETEGMR